MGVISCVEFGAEVNDAAEGWQLVGRDYVKSGMRHERDMLALIESGAIEATALVGIYLFRAVDEAEPGLEAMPD